MNIQSSQIPLPSEVSRNQALEAALFGGGDFELLFFMPEKRICNLSVLATTIGRVTKDPTIIMDNNILQKRGYLHHW